MSPVLYILLGFFVILPLIAVWVFCAGHILARPDLKMWQKAAWLLGILVLPIVGAAIYLVVWQRHGVIDDTAEWDDKSAEEIEEAVWRDQHMSSTDRMSDTRLQ
jgi:hypothetical protein